MRRLKVAAENARRLISTIPHKTCNKGVDKHWRLNPDGTVKAQSMLWLYCWAYNGMGSNRAKKVAIEVFNNLMEVTLAEMNSKVGHDYALRNRYPTGYIDEELDSKLA